MDKKLEALRDAARAATQASYEDLHDANLQFRKLANPATILALVERVAAMDDALDFEPDARHSVADMANVGYSLMQAIKMHRPDYAWNESPAEIVGDLIEELSIPPTGADHD